jgi:hypothetical protein
MPLSARFDLKIVDTKDAGAKVFYEHYGFTPLPDRPLTPYLALGH